MAKTLLAVVVVTRPQCNPASQGSRAAAADCATAVVHLCKRPMFNPERPAAELAQAAAIE
jgi:hypothetical protein